MKPTDIIHLLKALSCFFILMGSTSNYVKNPFPSIFFKKTYFSLVTEFPNFWQNQTFNHLSINYPQIREIVPRTLQHNPSKNLKNTHTSRLPIQTSRRFDSLSSASGGAIYVSNTHINSMNKSQLQL
jgi:hypothetical protein